MQVLVNTDDLSEGAAAEVKAIAAERLRKQRAKDKELRNIRKRPFGPPGTGDPNKFRRNDDTAVSDGKPQAPMKRDAEYVSAPDA